MNPASPGANDLELQRSLGRMEGKLDAISLILTEHIKKDEVAWQKVYSLEKKFVWFSGAAAVVVVFATSILRKIGILS